MYQVRDKLVKTFASPELAKGIFSLYVGPKASAITPQDMQDRQAWGYVCVEKPIGA